MRNNQDLSMLLDGIDSRTHYSSGTYARFPFQYIIHIWLSFLLTYRSALRLARIIRSASLTINPILHNIRLIKPHAPYKINQTVK